MTEEGVTVTRTIQCGLMPRGQLVKQICSPTCSLCLTIPASEKALKASPLFVSLNVSDCCRDDGVEGNRSKLIASAAGVALCICWRLDSC